MKYRYLIRRGTGRDARFLALRTPFNDSGVLEWVVDPDDPDAILVSDLTLAHKVAKELGADVIEYSP